MQSMAMAMLCNGIVGFLLMDTAAFNLLDFESCSRGLSVSLTLKALCCSPPSFLVLRSMLPAQSKSRDDLGSWPQEQGWHLILALKFIQGQADALQPISPFHAQRPGRNEVPGKPCAWPNDERPHLTAARSLRVNY